MPTLGPITTENPDEMMHSVFHMIGTTKVRAKNTKDIDGKLGVALPTQSLKIAPLEVVAEAIRSTVATATGLHREKFSLTSYIFMGADCFCYPVVDVKSEEPVDVELTRTVIFRLFEQVKRCDPHTQRLFSSDTANLGEQAEVALKAEATEILKRYGDSPISTPSKICVGGDAISAEFRGMFASKPDLSILKPQFLEFEGCIDGYRSKKREIFIDTNDGSLIINWEFDDQVVGNLSLAQKANLLVFKVSRTIDQRGNPINTLVSISKK